MAGGRFRFALEPIALQRQWALDALMLELSACNLALTRHADERDGLNSALAQADRDLRVQAEGGGLSVERHGWWSHYVADRQRALQRVTCEIAALQENRDGIIDRLNLAQRAVEALDDHRDLQRKEFIKARLSGEFKLADDHWGVLQTVRMSDGD